MKLSPVAHKLRKLESTSTILTLNPTIYIVSQKNINVFGGHSPILTVFCHKGACNQREKAIKF